MGSLIYRELYIARKFYITNIFVVLFFILLCSLVRLSMLYGNLAHLDPESFKAVDTITYYIFTYLIAYVAFSMLDDSGVILSDYRSNWRIFAYSLPVSPVKRVFVKYIIKFGAFCAAMVLSVINGAVIASLAGRDFGLYQILNFFLIVNFWLLVDVIGTPIKLCARSERGFHMSYAVYFVLMLVIISALMVKVTIAMAEIGTLATENDLDADETMFIIQQEIVQFFTDIHDNILVWMPLLTAAIIIIGFIICVQVLKRRES